ncbi:VOC family protein [Tessaracoccus sp. OS52]|uniref:VOC family protein n=1 Tax=Tessaracoccus sp. OS52 TaxID=2886691 RepID=UPI00272AC418|nr:VOC family protein [Tessaracoccus sp. OS52]
MAKQIQLTFDALSPRALGLFWAEVLGYSVDPPPGGKLGGVEETVAAWMDALAASDVPESEWDSAFALVDPDGVGPRIFIQRVPEPKTAKNRLHIDVRNAVGLEGDERMAILEAECERLLALGATRLRRFEPAPPLSHGFIVMADPEGNEFCLD